MTFASTIARHSWIAEILWLGWATSMLDTRYSTRPRLQSRNCQHCQQESEGWIALKVSLLRSRRHTAEAARTHLIDSMKAILLCNGIVVQAARHI